MTNHRDIPKTCHVICQSHIDMAWLWRWCETIEAIKETFQGEVDLLETYPDYTYAQSQLMTYMVVQERFPELFEKVRQFVSVGRWEIVGGELVECDHVIASGESLARQFLYGQLYARREFGLQSTVGWSPDSFGHCGSLPQILAKSGIESFIYKRPLAGEQPMPKTPFWWEGIDGTRVLAYRTTNKGWDFVNPIPNELAKRHNLRQVWGYSGTGDKGGVRPYKELGEDEHGEHVYSTPSRYFRAVRAETVDLPVYKGELNYCFEGIYTTHADAKMANRRCEYLLYLAESIATAAYLMGADYPHAELRDAWKILGFHQFHDILPGTSIPEVYEDAAPEYARLEEIARGVISRSAECFVEADDDCVTVFNPLPYARSAPVEVLATDGRRLLAEDLPPCSFRTFRTTDIKVDPPPTPDDLVLDNGTLRVTVDPDTGWISSVTDLRNGREALTKPGGNVLTLWKEDSYENDAMLEMSAWYTGISDRSECAEPASPPRRTMSEYGIPELRCIHKWGDSTFTSTLSLFPGSDFIDIRMECDWQEMLVMLRAEFSLNLSAEAEAWHEIPYGAVRREKSGAEAPSHRWVDVSDSLYGAALINDSRCGHSVRDNTLRMTLLRCANSPDPISDRGAYTFHYRFCPHERTWREGGIVRKAAELNVPVAVVPGNAVAKAALPELAGDDIELGACKLSEDGGSVVVRMYEPYGRPAKAELRIGNRFQAAHEANLLEDAQRSLVIADGAVALDFAPFEIKTVLLAL